MFTISLFTITLMSIKHCRLCTLPSLVRHCTLLATVKDQSSHLVYLNICIKQQTCENWSSIGRWSCKITMKEKTALVTPSCVLSDAWYQDLKRILNLSSRNQIHVKLILSRKLPHFRGSRFSQCFILSTSSHYLLNQVRFDANNYFE